MTVISAYEAERNARIARNNLILQQLNIPQAVQELEEVALQARRLKQAQRQKSKPRAEKAPQLLEKRRSGRLSQQPAVEYNEAVLDQADAHPGHRRSNEQVQELYTEDHIKLLGDCKEEWVLFVDGFDSNGNRIYDKVNGQTCHQCRQKTIGLRTECSECHSLAGVFCGDCLFMRYGENIKEAKQNASWICPPCRGICNCSIHRIRKGLAPTGSLYRQAVAAGFKSAAHMLILENQAPKSMPEPVSVPSMAPMQGSNVQVSSPAMENQLPGKVAGVRQQPKKAAKVKQGKIDDLLPQQSRYPLRKKLCTRDNRSALQIIGLAA